eukprot:403369534
MIGYIHEGYKVSNDGHGLFGQEPDKTHQLSKFKEKDIIYVYKDREEGLRELSEMGRVAKLSYTYVVLLFGISVFLFVQYALYSNAQECKAQTPVLYVWLICEVIVFYVTLALFIAFGGYYAWRFRHSIKQRAMKYINKAAGNRNRLEFL